MPSISWRYETFNYEEDDFRFPIFQLLIELESAKRLDSEDVKILSSLFSLHSKLPDLQKRLISQGFLLNENTRRSGDVKERWEKDDVKVSYDVDDHWTMYNRSDRHIVTSEYVNGDITGKHVYVDSESDYGRIKRNERRFYLTISDEVLLEHTEDLRA